MFSSSVLDVAIGVVFAFLGVSLITSAVVEAINSLFKLRSMSLLNGVKGLVNDPGFMGLAKALYEHAAVNPRGFSPSTAATAAAGTDARAVERDAVARPLSKKPAYIDPHQFANALLDITGLSAAAGTGPAPGPAAVTAFRAALAANIAAVENPQIKALLQGIVDRTGGDIDLVRKEVACWFDSAMDRVGGAFKRRTQLFSFLIALSIAALLNVDTIHLATALWEHPAVVDQLKLPDTVKAALATAATDNQEAVEVAAANLTSVLGNLLPVGWAPGHFLEAHMRDPKNHALWKWDYFYNDTQGLLFILGWVLTAIATLFGAPFWFDLLQSFVRLKGAGPSPQEKKDGTAASA